MPISYQSRLDSTLTQLVAELVQTSALVNQYVALVQERDATIAQLQEQVAVLQAENITVQEARRSAVDRLHQRDAADVAPEIQEITELVACAPRPSNGHAPKRQRATASVLGDQMD